MGNRKESRERKEVSSVESREAYLTDFPDTGKGDVSVQTSNRVRRPVMYCILIFPSFCIISPCYSAPKFSHWLKNYKLFQINSRKVKKCHESGVKMFLSEVELKSEMSKCSSALESLRYFLSCCLVLKARCSALQERMGNMDLCMLNLSSC